MKRYLFLLPLLLFALSSNAQETTKKKWVAPKRPKVKWVAPKRKDADEVIDVWRPYGVTDNLFMEFGAGVSSSFAENSSGKDFFKICQPSFQLGFGKQTSYLFSTRLTFGYARQKGWADPNIAADYPVMKDGGYLFSMASAFLDEKMSIVNLICPYNEHRWFDMQLFVGVGVNYSWGFEKKTKTWDRFNTGIDHTDHVNLNLRGGVQMLFAINNSIDLYLQGTYNMIGDSYNGLTHSDKFAFDPCVDVSLGFAWRFPDHYGDHRYKKVHRNQATALRAEDAKIADFLDNEKLDALRRKEASEVVAYGQLMKTHVAFYVDRAFVNDEQQENLRIVADFLKRNPDVNLVVKGYCGASKKSESPDMHLAQRRVEAVRKSLIRYFNVDQSRVRLWYDEDAVAPFPMQGEWIDAVVFEMERK